MNFVKKIRICLVVGLVLVFGCSIALANPTVNIVNLSGGSIYIYDTGGSTQTPIVLADGKTLSNHTLAAAAGRRIWVASDHLKTVESGGQPSPFDTNADAGVMFSFFEYTVTGDKYTIDLSYVDYFSYLLTLKFKADDSNICVKDFEYGFKSFTHVANALMNAGNPWNQLIWQGYGPKKTYRIFAPSFIWTSNPASLPTNLKTFYNAYPPDGTQLFLPNKNNEVWQNYAQIPGFNVPVEPRLITVGYSKALLSNSSVDRNKKHGFYIFPKDAQAEFTNLQNSNTMTVTVYPYK